ncbi:MAG: GNAT family N-acetyltransferase [Arenicella sp.]|nr:GNAT family N-acetyltransferase [Arenicella sp.]
MSIRLATSFDAEIVSKLVIDSSLSVKDQDFSDEGWALLEKTNTIESVSKRFESEKYFALIFEVQGVPAGYLAMVEFEKIDHMFVMPEYRNIGIAKSLWHKAQEICVSNGNVSYYWVRSSSYAVQVYESFGFRLSGDKKISNGISFQLMERGERNER